MALESASFISGLVSANPPGTDAISQGDDHIRLIKTVLKATLPNGYQAMNGIHTGSEPTSNSTGQLWFDTSANLLKMRNEANDGWIILAASLGSKLLSTTHQIMTDSSFLRSDAYIDSSWSISHTKLSASSTLYIQVNGMIDMSSAWDGGSNHQYTYMRLAKSDGTLISGTTDDLLKGDMKDDGFSVSSSAEIGFGFSHIWKVTAANCPDTPSAVGSNTFDIWTKPTTAAGGGTTFAAGVMMAWEIEE